MGIALAGLGLAWLLWPAPPPDGLDRIFLPTSDGVRAAGTGRSVPGAQYAGWSSSLDGQVVATRTGLVELRRDGKRIQTWRPPRASDPTCLRWSWSPAPDGRWLFVQRVHSRRVAGCSSSQPGDLWSGVLAVDTGEVVSLDVNPVLVGWRGEELWLRPEGLSAILAIDPASPLQTRRVHGGLRQVHAASADGQALLVRLPGGAIAVKRVGADDLNVGDLLAQIPERGCGTSVRDAGISADGRVLMLRLTACPDGSTRRERVVFVDLQTEAVLFNRLIPRPTTFGPPGPAPGDVPRFAWAGDDERGRFRWHVATLQDGHVDVKTTLPPKGFWPGGRHRFEKLPGPLQKLLARVARPAHHLEARAATWTPDGRAMVSLTAGRLRWWDVETNREGGTRLEVGGPVHALHSLSPGRATIVRTHSPWWGFPTADRLAATPDVPSSREALAYVALARGDKGWADPMAAATGLTELCEGGDPTACWEGSRLPAFAASQSVISEPRRLACLEGVGQACRALVPKTAATSIDWSLVFNQPERIELGLGVGCGERDKRVTCLRGAGAAFWPPGGDLSGVTVGGKHACALRHDGAPVCWGRGGREDETQGAEGEPGHRGQALPPPEPFVALAAGWDHTCGLRADGTVACWGADDHGQISPPQGRFDTISAGTGTTCGLRSGKATCWGRGPTSPGRFASVDVGWDAACGVKTDGSLRCWTLGAESSEVVDKLSATLRVDRVAVGEGRACALQDGAITCWGGSGTTPLSLSGPFTDVAVGRDEVCGAGPHTMLVCPSRAGRFGSVLFGGD